MTQRVFDIENEKDMADLWDILPDEMLKIKKSNFDGCYLVDKNEIGFYVIQSSIIKINWHDKTEITRPIQEATEADIGKLCKFWNNAGLNAFGVLSNIYNGENDNYKMSYGGYWEHCRRLTKQEIEELC